MARNQRGADRESLRTGKRQYAKEGLLLNGTERAKHVGTRSSSGKRGDELWADQSPSPEKRMNGLASPPLIPPYQEVDTKRDREISPHNRSGYDLFEHSTQPNPAHNQKTLWPRSIQYTGRHLRSFCLFKVAVCRHYLMLCILTRVNYYQ